jgi:acyl-CoA thioester hydrolase
MADAFELPLRVRYMEADAQGVVFNSWYLTYFDEAFTAFLGGRGSGYATLIESGFDFQLVHSEIDWKSGLRWPDEFVVAVSTARVGRTSFAMDFEVRRGGEVTCSARTVYVAVSTDGWGKCPIPPALATALGEPAPLRADTDPTLPRRLPSGQDVAAWVVSLLEHPDCLLGAPQPRRLLQAACRTSFVSWLPVSVPQGCQGVRVIVDTHRDAGWAGQQPFDQSGCGALLRSREPLNATVEFSTRRQNGQIDGVTRSSMPAPACLRARSSMTTFSIASTCSSATQ